MSRRVARRRGVSGLGATSTGTLIGTGAATGAAVGSVVPVIGTAIGGVVGAVVGAVSGLFGGGHATNPNAVAITNKWYNWFLGRPADPSGAGWWPNQINADGAPNAWQNFSTSKEPAAAGVAQRAAQYQQLGYGAPTDPPPPGTNQFVAPPLTMTYQQYLQQPGMASAVAASPASAGASILSLLTASTSPQTIASMTPAQQQAAVAQASLIPTNLSPTAMLFVGGAILATVVFGTKKTRSTRRRS